MSDPADALFLVLLLVLPVSALIIRRIPMSAMVRMMLVWAAVFAILFGVVLAWRTM